MYQSFKMRKQQQLKATSGHQHPHQTENPRNAVGIGMGLKNNMNEFLDEEKVRIGTKETKSSTYGNTSGQSHDSS